MKSSKSSLFLLELIISILFFAIASAACIQLFAKAHLLDVKTGEQNQAIIWSQNLVELWKAGSGDLQTVYDYLADDYVFSDGAVTLDESGETLSLTFDESWNLITGNITYRIVFKSTNEPDENGLINGEITFYKDMENPEIFYSLPLQQHISLRGGH